jgi:hypothetical protein
MAESDRAAVSIRVSCSEAIDRLSILRLRVANGTASNQEEIAAQIEEYVRTIDALNLKQEVRNLWRRLDRTNAMLWRLENAIRACERDRDFGPRYISVSRMIRRLNDRRAIIKSQIDQSSNSAFVVKKSYA